MKSGFPTPAEENLLDSMTLDTYLVGNREASFMMRVAGDAMREHCIRDGDFVIVERTHEAKPGRIAIIEVGGTWAMREMDRDQSFPIVAVVMSVVRKYG